MSAHDTTLPPLVVDCRDGTLCIPAQVYLRDWRGDPAEDMLLFRVPGEQRQWLGRMRFMRRPLPGEARAAGRMEVAYV